MRDVIKIVAVNITPSMYPVAVHIVVILLFSSLRDISVSFRLPERMVIAVNKRKIFVYIIRQTPMPAKRLVSPKFGRKPAITSWRDMAWTASSFF